MRVNSGEGSGENMTVIANTIRSDRDSLDGLLIIGEYCDPDLIPGIHKLIATIRPPGMQVILVTSGRSRSTIDDLVGAGYVDRVGFLLDDVPDREQRETMRTVTADGAVFDIVVIMDPRHMDNDTVLGIASSVDGYDAFILLTPTDCPAYGKRDMNALAKSLRGRARNVRVNSGRFRTLRGRVRPRGSGA